MQVGTAKQKMRDGRPAYGYGLSLGSAFAAELLSRSGIDWLLPDTQYGVSGHDAAFAARVAMAGGTPAPMARVARNDVATPGVDGCLAGPADLALSADQGWQFLTAGADAGFMLSVARAGLHVCAW